MTCAEHIEEHGREQHSHDAHSHGEHSHGEHNHDEHNHDEHNHDEHNEFDCSRARLQLYEYLDGEMDPDDCVRIRQHLEQCGPCLKEYDIDQTLKALVRRSCGCEVAPTELRTQIISRITTINMTVEIRD